MAEAISPPEQERYLLVNATLPGALTAGGLDHVGDGLGRADILIENGGIAAVSPCGVLRGQGLPESELDGGLVLPGFIDMHTHLDKGHIWPRKPNPDGTFDGALAAVATDRAAHWSAEDLRRRMEFALRCAHAHGTVMIRTHIDSVSPQDEITWPVFRELRRDWADRIELQGAALYGVDLLNTPGFLPRIADRVAEAGGVLGAVTYMIDGLEGHLDSLFQAAAERGLDLDFHVDETGDPGARSLRLIAEAALRNRFEGRIVCGHCCSLARQDADEVDRTLDLVARAGLGVVSLPMCNMYLMDRKAGRTPRWRGVTLLHEMKARGIPVAVASDNTRDPFYAYGDLDMVELFSQATRILHLDHPVGDWIDVVTQAPAWMLGDASQGRLDPGGRADLVVFRARNWNELVARPSGPRTVLRGGRAIERALPDYRELDDLMERL
ncbi:cytosine deaminase [Stappia taiwanensis]|uniref:Cytosine deaminase n=1 Tax=Stappia taiwanensis TaxID=992267 RepID=A0A838XUV9_9HYPH|nr:cytosine deaminase [Stappia taiwanensis]MBA4612398.1 cytosine deaminase [Stappia taiwanensis]GGF05043.1 amidohydrolase [Stappia taiwanensis]